VFLGDRPSLVQLAGGAAILGGLALLLHSPLQPELVEEYR